MKTLMLLALFCQEDDRKAERERMDLLRRVAPTVVQIGQKTSDRSSVIQLLTTVGENVYTPTYTPSTTVGGEVLLYELALASTFGESGGRLAGFFIDEKGTFVTTTEALSRSGFDGTVTLSDGRRVQARLLTKEKEIGLAILQIDGASKPLKLGDSSTVEAGRTAVIVTFAGDSPVLRHAAVVGRSRKALGTASVEDFLHLDYPALPSEVGAAVLNLDGEVIGILAEPVWEQTRWQGSTQSVPRRAYVIPVATIKAFLAKRGADGRFELGFLGVSLQDAKDGAEITKVRPGDPADRAGLKVGDVVVAADGRPVRDEADLTRVTRFRARERVELQVRRGGSTLTVAVTVGVWEEPKPAPDEPQLLRDLGLETTDLTDDLRKFLDCPVEKGLVVRKVLAGSRAESAGLRKGDVITKSEDASGDYVVIETYRDGKKVPVVVKKR